MGLEIKLKQSLQQSLVMTPQLKQAIELLQLGRFDYVKAIEQELLGNPVLSERITDSSLNEKQDPLPEAGSLDFSTLRDTVSHSSPGRPTGDSDFSDRDKDFCYGDAPATSAPGLVQHLLGQLQFIDLSEEDRSIATQVIGNLDRDGFLELAPLELANTLEVPVAKIEEVRREVQSLDPLAVASLNMTDSLLFQLEMRGYGASLASILVKSYLDVLANGNVEKVYKEQGVSLEDVKRALAIIRELTPFPGRMFAEEAPRYIEPDVYVVKVDGQYQVSLNTDGLPELSLNDEYLALLESAEPNSPQALFLAEKLKSANFLIRSVEQRKRTIQKVMKSILKYQYEFFREGPSALKPLVLKDVAADIAMHESTISRVTSNKYVHTDRGVFELKYFFSSSIKSSTGDLASEAVKVRLKELVTAEDSKKPLSDQRLADMLAEEGIKVARRTVAKYRESMQILSARKRKDKGLLS